jgi:hypothetical protein
MQTQRLASLTNPSHVEHLLDSYVGQSGRVPAAARKRSGWHRVPAELRHFAVQAISDGYVCAVWTDGESNWFFAAILSLERAREIGRPVLEVHRFDDGEHVRDRVLASMLPDGTWCHCSD